MPTHSVEMVRSDVVRWVIQEQWRLVMADDEDPDLALEPGRGVEASNSD